MLYGLWFSIIQEVMCIMFVDYLNEKLCALISLASNFISGILLFLWKNDASKTAIVNAIDKIIHAIVDIFILFRTTFCHKEKNEKVKEQKKEISPLERGRMILSTSDERQKVIDELLKFVEDNNNNEDTKIKDEVEKAKRLLESLIKKIKEETQKINIYSKKLKTFN